MNLQPAISRILFWVFLAPAISIFTGLIHAAPDEVPPGLPKDYQRKAAQYVRERAEAIQAMEAALKDPDGSKDAAAESAMQGVQAASRQLASDAKQALSGATGADKSALEELIKFCNSEYTNARIMLRDGQAGFTQRDRAYKTIEAVNLAAENSTKSRERISGRMSFLAGIIDTANKAGVSGGLGVGEEMNVLKEVLADTYGNQALAEFLTASVDREINQMEALVRDTQTYFDIFRRDIKDLDDDASLVGPWKASKARWDDIMGDHEEALEKAKNSLVADVQKPWLAYMKEWGRETIIDRLNLAVNRLTGRIAELEEELEEEEKELLEKISSTEEKLKEAEDEKTRLENEIKRVEKLLEVRAESRDEAQQLADEATDDDEKQSALADVEALEEGIERDTEYLETLQANLEAAEQIIAEVKDELKELK